MKYILAYELFENIDREKIEIVKNMLETYGRQGYALTVRALKRYYWKQTGENIDKKELNTIISRTFKKEVTSNMQNGKYLIKYEDRMIGTVAK